MPYGPGTYGSKRGRPPMKKTAKKKAAKKARARARKFGAKKNDGTSTTNKIKGK